MCERQAHAADRHNGLFGQGQRIMWSPHRNHRRQLPQVAQHVAPRDIAEMDDQVHVLEQDG